MRKYSKREFDELRMRLQQHEDLIIQLVEITAASNRKLHVLTEGQTESTRQQSLLTIHSP
ncbi:MAG TPA: hypothetical protein VK044_07480 [Virgibacillus sp.]|nr:hypothetical protein [Virgibacillus sp.]